ncbi:MAG: hypothetical protein A3F43_02220 [Gammaproteobacteria bacterium RIFCSPHIGHO2_12_FULL_42_10]|nr:MAG: hypothetical protein A3F43_02220 [Gammaproteobacteria bacterium RIFCSPHIGHO2_12_FULL_42_10]
MEMFDDFVFEAKEQFSKLGNTLKRINFNKKKQLAFLEDLYLLINDGIPANRAVEMMAQVTTGVTREVSLTLTNKISEGQPLAEGMKEWFTPNVVEIIRVGEAGGAMAETMKSAINMLAQQGMAFGAFAGAIAYPSIVVLMGCGMIIYLEGSVFEQFKLIKPPDQWPEAGQSLLNLAYMIKTWWWAAILFVIAFVIAMRRMLTNFTGEMRATLDQYPPFTLYRKLVSARLLETLGLLVANGVVFKSAITVMQYQANPYVAWHLARMENLLSKGKSNIADVLDTGLIEHSNLMRLRVMAEVKGFEHGLVRMGVRGTAEATQALKTISKAIGMVLMIIGGYLIIMIIRGMFLTGMSMAG